MNSLRPFAQNPAPAFRATAVIVLYRMAAEDSPAYCSLIEAQRNLGATGERVQIVLWDNSPSAQEPRHLSPKIRYLHDPRNLGLANAYNRALEIASSEDFDWLITLDQDTEVPRDYLTLLAAAARLCVDRSDIGAIVPQLAAGHRQLSPYYFAWRFLPRWYRSGYQGVPKDPVFAFNSGAMIRVAALQQIRGYDPRFPLEYSDTAMFHKLHQHGKRIYIAGNIQPKHEFSLIEMDRLLSGQRYRRTMLAESAFWDLNMSPLAGMERTCRLFLRMLRQFVRRERLELRRVTAESLLMRILQSRRSRLRKWYEFLSANGALAQETALSYKSKIQVSVCMATYNGGEFVEAQLLSILPQLSGDDEIVIVDDASQDDTIARLARIRGPRIRILRHSKNQGVVATFEDALRCATGDILFLCDDDDLWAPTKVQRVLTAFNGNPNAQIVTTRVALIDNHGDTLPDARINRYGRFISGFWQNVIRNHYQGSAMAIRASFLGNVLPFPQKKLFLHDVWIGTRSEVLGGKTIFIDDPLLYYRRHAGNVSQTLPAVRQIRLRIELLMAHITRAHHVSLAHHASAFTVQSQDSPEYGKDSYERAGRANRSKHFQGSLWRRTSAVLMNRFR